MPVRDLLNAASGASSLGPADPYFYNVTLLLNGDGTNGAQNNTFLDSSSNNFTITRAGNTTQGSFSPFGSNWSMYSGGACYLQTSYSGTIGSSADFTVECFAYLTYTQDNSILCCADNSMGLIYFRNGSRFSTSLNGTTVEWQSSAITLNTWHHLVVQRSGGTVSAYLDGTRVGTPTSISGGWSWNNMSGSGTPFLVGQSNSREQGYLSNIRYSNVARYSGTTITVPTAPFTTDANTVFLIGAANSYTQDASGNNRNLSSGGNNWTTNRFSPFNITTPYDTATIGGSGYWSGSGDYLSAASNSAWSSGTSDFTYETWIYPTAPSTNLQSIVNFRDGNINNFEIRMDSLQLQLHWDGSLIFNGSTNATAYAWNHVALVRSSGTITMYLNGVSIGSTGTSYNFNQYTTAYFGGYGGGGSSWAYYGFMSNTRFVNGTAIYTSTFTPPTAPLTAVANTKVLLSFKNAGIFDSAMMNDLVTVGNAQVSTTQKKFGTASMYFDGSGDWLISADGTLNTFNSGNFTIEGWAYTASYGSSTQQLVAKGGSGSSSGWYVAIRSTGKLEFGKPTTPVLTSSASVGTNAWFYFTVTRSNGTIYLFINGTLDSTTSDTTNYNDTSNTYVAVFGDGSSQPLTGYIDDLRLTKGYARYTSSFTAPTAALPTY